MARVEMAQVRVLANHSNARCVRRTIQIQIHTYIAPYYASLMISDKTRALDIYSRVRIGERA